jgi:hypothetical protein
MYLFIYLFVYLFIYLFVYLFVPGWLFDRMVDGTRLMTCDEGAFHYYPKVEQPECPHQHETKEFVNGVPVLTLEDPQTDLSMVNPSFPSPPLPPSP